VDQEPFDIEAWVAESRTAQGLPPTIEDPSALAKVVALMDDQPPMPLEK
jgi:hypothetical protein